MRKDILKYIPQPTLYLDSMAASLGLEKSSKAVKSKTRAKAKTKDGSFCAFCCDPGSKANKLKACAGCEMVAYCNSQCQKSAWPEHKSFCKSMAARSAAVSLGSLDVDVLGVILRFVGLKRLRKIYYVSKTFLRVFRRATISNRKLRGGRMPENEGRCFVATMDIARFVAVNRGLVTIPTPIKII